MLELLYKKIFPIFGNVFNTSYTNIYEIKIFREYIFEISFLLHMIELILFFSFFNIFL